MTEGAPRRRVRLEAVDPDDPLAFEVRHGDVVVPVRFSWSADGKIASVRTGSTRGGFLEPHRRPQATSVGLWGQVGAGAAVLSAVAAGVRRRSR